ncbi:MAG: ribonuclease III [Bacteroidota bacterium]
MGFYPRDIYLYKTALRHKSASIITSKSKLNNERFEFLGDAIIDAVVSDYLYKACPDVDEGTLTLIRANMVQRKSMNKIAVKMGIPDLLITGDESCNRTESIFGNALEALVGAVYIDRGYKFCCRFIENKFIPEFDQDKILQVEYDHKSALFHLVQDKKWDIEFDTFEQIEENESVPHFESHVLVNNIYISKGKGWSKKEAEQNAASSALDDLAI